MVRLPGYARPQAGRALRRPAPAGRPGAGDRQPAQGAAARRAARRPRPEAARADAGRAEVDPGRGRDHLRLRHPRPGRGADDERPDRGLQRGPDRAGRARRSSSTSSPANEFVAGFVGVSNVLERDGERFTIRPEKIAAARRRAPPPTACTPSAAASPTSPTPGWSPATRSRLDAGGELQLVRQNVEGASAGRAARAGQGGRGRVAPGARGRRPRRSQRKRRNHREEQGRKPRPDGVAGRRRPARVHARCSPAAAAAAATAQRRRRRTAEARQGRGRSST